MPRNNLPTYAIVELLIRLSGNYPAIGNYKDHTIYDAGVVVKTSGGTINFPVELVMQQFSEPETISDNDLQEVASSFKLGRL